MIVVIVVLGLLLITLPYISGVDDIDVFEIDDPSSVAHFDALGYDISFKSYE